MVMAINTWCKHKSFKKSIKVRDKTEAQQNPLLILEEEPIISFVPCPPPFSFPNKVVSGAIVEVRNFEIKCLILLFHILLVPMVNILSDKTFKVIINLWSLR